MTGPSARPPTMEDVARGAGVSRSLVSLALRDSPRVSEASRARVLRAAEALHYRPNAMARNLASRRTATVGVVVNDLHNPFFAGVIDGIEAAADEHGHRVLLNAANRSARREKAAIEMFLAFRCDGIILTGPSLPASVINAAAEVVPVVAVGRAMRSAAIDTVVNDDHHGAELAVEHLTGLGHRSIVHIDGGRGAGANARRRGYLAAMERLRLGAEAAVVPGDFTDRAGVDAVERLLADGDLPTAIFAANDLVAAGALDRLEDEGVAVPGDVSIVGYDNTSIAALHHMSLTTIGQPDEEMGRLAFQAVYDRLMDQRTEPVRHVLPPSLFERGTTAPPRPPEEET